ncbi:30S ribosomal protein S7 [Candidatus Desantisbacteria bacterium CG_4_10_14_0_8_um_filter_48_22]|uniref:Small ribosomal subunit protein uS7 n=1 Tax=Candidatus Desantisbacteria bacterium CG_4_10_14_0_8_um_filter_48_22 TaxID=1974543 RepID=A0A2M7S9G7_9BACT|nr:MAG: 30S ribosomal protein S7 [Candidatus Desantisbacteria bacterium CG1_02_49_89]PIV54686.1 MAG: 30S ribosomal protein S7 [Candidatus Desantisbacteria bacterium CG02_land_8_20_14_3_00_49_13]PIZ16186.1 MAG: 30S ribosomal protein S7 [Candidatus Desantisbacteria bacterium CG_4_10_14_0_8_um_filter_48_22]
MPRRRVFFKRKYEADPVYGDILIGKFINMLMKQGKKGLAQKIFYKSLEIIKQKTGKPPEESFRKAIANTKPMLEVKPRRVGGATYQVPIEVNESRGMSLAIRWIITAAKQKKGKPMAAGLAEELLDASNNKGAAVKKREDTHKMADANRAFAHYRW